MDRLHKRRVRACRSGHISFAGTQEIVILQDHRLHVEVVR